MGYVNDLSKCHIRIFLLSYVNIFSISSAITFSPKLLARLIMTIAIFSRSIGSSFMAMLSVISSSKYFASSLLSIKAFETFAQVH